MVATSAVMRSAMQVPLRRGDPASFMIEYNRPSLWPIES